MPKLKNVTPEELAKVLDMAGEIGGEASNIANRMQSGYADELSGPLSAASQILSVSRGLAELASILLMKAALQEQRREIEGAMRKRLDDTPTNEVGKPT